jgi:hypothetical protein
MWDKKTFNRTQMTLVKQINADFSKINAEQLEHPSCYSGLVQAQLQNHQES